MGKKIKTILFVDDDQDDQLLFREALSGADSSIICTNAFNGTDAIEKLTTGILPMPDLLFMDINMPKMNGIDCLKELKRSEQFKAIPVIMYSTSFSKEYQKDCFKNGAVGYMEKPTDFWLLCDKIKEIVSNGLPFENKTSL